MADADRKDDGIPERVRSWSDLITWLAETRHPNTKHPSRRGTGSHYAMALHLGCSPAIVPRWASGNVAMPDARHLAQIAEVYGIPYARVAECALRSFTGRELHVSEAPRSSARRGKGPRRSLALLVGASLLGASATLAPSPVSAGPHFTARENDLFLIGSRGRRKSHRRGLLVRIPTPWGPLRRVMRPAAGPFPCAA